MRYALLVYNDRARVEALDEAQRAAMAADYNAIDGIAGVVSRLRLKDIETATTVRSEQGKMLVTDGPFANTKEVFGGLFLVEADNLDGALEIAAKIPSTSLGGCVEIRPVFE
jgi:hypothetical protein